MESKMPTLSTQSVYILDVDNTLVSSRLDGPGIIYNESLIKALQAVIKDDDIIVLMTAWQAYHNLHHNARQHTTRLEVIEHLQQAHLPVAQVIVTASPFAEVSDLNLSGNNTRQLPFGEYYQQRVLPLEKAVYHRSPTEVTAIMKAQESSIEAEQQLIKSSAHQERYQQSCYQNGKEIMLRHILAHYQSQPFAKRRFVVLDDNTNVIRVTEAIAKETEFTAQNIVLAGILVLARDERQDIDFFKRHLLDPELPPLPLLPPLNQPTIRHFPASHAVKTSPASSSNQPADSPFWRCMLL